MTLPPGTKLGRYEIRSQIGAGGMGEVFLAQDTRLNRQVAIKVLPPDTIASERANQRLMREARASANLDHPNICAIHEVADEDGRSFIVMQFVDGETLDIRIKRKAFALSESLAIAIQVADALAEAHAHGVVHRDVKPSNIMITARGAVKVMDFGLAKLIPQSEVVQGEAETEALMSTPGAIIGTLPYMSPEQVRGETIDGRSDIFSFGVVLYEMLGGQQPFASKSSAATASAILTHEPPPLARFAREVPAELERIVEKALRKDREERYQTIKDMLLDLRSLKHRLEFEAQLERSREPEASSDAAVTSSSDQMTAAVGPATLGGEAAQTAPNTESFVGRIKRHQRSVMIGLTVLVLAAGATLFWYFKHTRAAPVLTDKDTILLADFDNKTGDEVFDGALKQGLAIQLGQSPFLSIFPESSVRQTLKLMNRSPDERVIREVAREMCERQGLKAFIAGSIAPLGSHYVLTLEVVNGHGGEVLVREQTQAESKEQVLKALSQAASSLREKLGESLSSIEKFNAPLQQATTSSLEALKSYSLGVDGINKRGAYLESIPFFKRAVELDPNFASAYARLSLAYYNSRQLALAVGYAQKAFEMRERVSGRERFYIESRYYSDATGEINKAIETYELWKQTYPRDIVPWTNVSGRYLEIGQFEKTVENAREALRRHPTIAAANSNLAEALILLNRFEEAREVSERGFDTEGVHRALYQIAFVGGDTARMQQQLDWARGRLDEYIALDWQADTAAFAGQYRHAEDFSRRSINLATRSESKEVAAGYAAKSALHKAVFGHCAQAKESATQSLALTPKEVPPSRAALALALCGAAAQTEHLMDESARQYPKSTRLNSLWLPTIRAAREMQRGNAAQAIELLQPASQYEAADEFWPQYVRGQTYLKLNQGAEAAAQFHKILDHRGEAPLSALYSLAHLGLARALTLQGETAKARKAYEAFLALWKEADTDIPILIEAKKEYEKLPLF